MKKRSIPRLPYVRDATKLRPRKTFNERAVATWNQLGSTFRDADFLPSEQTLTENNLAALALRHNSFIDIYKTTGWQESRTGADWIWVFEGSHGWCGFFVQAKKLDILSGYYPELRKKEALAQLDRLLSTTARFGFQALYCLYNSMLPRELEHLTPPIACPLNGRSPKDIRSLGCSLVAATRIRSSVETGDVSYTDLQKFAIPWECIISCRCRNRAATQPIQHAQRAFQTLTEDLSRSVGEQTGDSEFRLRTEPPAFLERLRSGESVFAEDLDGVGYVVHISRLPGSDE